MMIFDLRCANGHAFEGWFQNMDDFENQCKKKLVPCPFCNAVKVTRVPSKVSIKMTNTDACLSEEHQNSGTENPLNRLVEFLNQNFENVGSDFAKEALKIRYGVSEKRNIRGTSTTEEEKMLEKEAIPFYKIPISSHNYNS
jgi:hypothetical protein